MTEAKLAFEFPSLLSVEGESFSLVSVQRGRKTAVYKGTNSYLRMGEAAAIEKMLLLHKRMETEGFPIAPLLAEGQYQGMRYFTEATLGEKRFGDTFLEQITEHGRIDKETFDRFLAVAVAFGRAQIQERHAPDWDGFSNGIHLGILKEELPEYREKIDERFEQVKQKLSVLPFVLSHGDFNANNLYPKGVIDFEDSFCAPFGYDLMSALVHIRYFPQEEGFEFRAKYDFTDEEISRYRNAIDGLSQELGFGPLSVLENEFEFCRGSWSLVRMQEFPKLQRFRYDVFIQKFLT